MKWLSVLALCAALFIAATHASHLDEEGTMDRAAEEEILQMLLADQVDAENDEEIELADRNCCCIQRKDQLSS